MVKIKQTVVRQNQKFEEEIDITLDPYGLELKNNRKRRIDNRKQTYQILQDKKPLVRNKTKAEIDAVWDNMNPTEKDEFMKTLFFKWANNQR